MMGIANYAYDWPDENEDESASDGIGAELSGSGGARGESEADVTFDPNSLNAHYSYVDEDNITSPGVDARWRYGVQRAPRGGTAGVRGTVVWRLGSEDPSMWSIWDVDASHGGRSQ